MKEIANDGDLLVGTEIHLVVNVGSGEKNHYSET